MRLPLQAIAGRLEHDDQKATRGCRKNRIDVKKDQCDGGWIPGKCTEIQRGLPCVPHSAKQKEDEHEASPEKHPLTSHNPNREEQQQRRTTEPQAEHCCQAQAGFQRDFTQDSQTNEASRRQGYNARPSPTSMRDRKGLRRIGLRNQRGWGFRGGWWGLVHGSEILGQSIEYTCSSSSHPPRQWGEFSLC